MGWPVPGCSGGGSGVARSAWMLYHRVGSSRSESRYFVVMSAGLRAMSPSFVVVRPRLARPRRVLGQLEIADGVRGRHTRRRVPALLDVVVRHDLVELREGEAAV